MKPVKKIYRSTFFPRLHKIITVGNRAISIDFTGETRFPVRKNGYYITDDPDMQQALETSVAFNNEYVLESLVEDKGSQPEIPDPSTITNFMQALEYLSKYYSVDSDSVASIEAVVAKATDLGLEFVNWKRPEQNTDGKVNVEGRNTQNVLLNGSIGIEGKEEGVPNTAGITNYTNAKEYLRKYYNVDVSNMQNAEAIRAIAENLKVDFPDWKKQNNGTNKDNK